MANLPRATVMLPYHYLPACAYYITEISVNFVTYTTPTTFAPIAQLKDDLNIS